MHTIEESMYGITEQVGDPYYDTVLMPFEISRPSLKDMFIGMQRAAPTRATLPLLSPACYGTASAETVVPNYGYDIRRSRVPMVSSPKTPLMRNPKATLCCGYGDVVWDAAGNYADPVLALFVVPKVPEAMQPRQNLLVAEIFKRIFEVRNYVGQFQQTLCDIFDVPAHVLNLHDGEHTNPLTMLYSCWSGLWNQGADGLRDVFRGDFQAAVHSLSAHGTAFGAAYNARENHTGNRQTALPIVACDGNYDFQTECAVFTPMEHETYIFMLNEHITNVKEHVRKCQDASPYQRTVTIGLGTVELTGERLHDEEDQRGRRFSRVGVPQVLWYPDGKPASLSLRQEITERLSGIFPVNVTVPLYRVLNHPEFAMIPKDDAELLRMSN